MVVPKDQLHVPAEYAYLWSKERNLERSQICVFEEAL
jgi:hypothetical protein